MTEHELGLIKRGETVNPLLSKHGQLIEKLELLASRCTTRMTQRHGQIESLENSEIDTAYAEGAWDAINKIRTELFEIINNSQ